MTDSVEVEIPLEGLLALEGADFVLEDLKDLIEIATMNEGQKKIGGDTAMGHVRNIDRMRKQINERSGPYSMRVEVQLTER
jgi:hypothetical protein